MHLCFYVCMLYVNNSQVQFGEFVCSDPVDDFISLMSPSRLKEKQRRQTADHRAIIPYLDLNGEATHTTSDSKRASFLAENITDDEEEDHAGNDCCEVNKIKLTLDANYQYDNSCNPIVSPSARMRSEKDYVNRLIRRNSLKEETH